MQKQSGKFYLNVSLVKSKTQLQSHNKTSPDKHLSESNNNEKYFH